MGSALFIKLLLYYTYLQLCHNITDYGTKREFENFATTSRGLDVFKVFGIIDSYGLNLTCIMNVFHYYEVWTFIVLAENSSHLVMTILPHREMKMKPLINLHH